MGKFDGVLLVSDFDDTLYATNHQVPERNLRALEYFIAEGGRFTVATGRAHRTFAPYVHLAPINAPVILSNGAAIYDFKEGRMLEETNLPLEAPEEMGEVVKRFPSLGLETYHAEDIYVWNPNEITFAHLKKVGCDYIRCEIADMPTPWIKGLFHQEHEVLLGAREMILSQYGDRYEAIFSNPYYLEITAKGSTKGGMVSKLADMLGIRPEHIYCVGDNQNDTPMLEKAAIPFAPANCAQELKDWGAHIVCHCDDGVIGDIVDILDERYS